MVGLGLLMLVVTAWALWRARRRRAGAGGLDRWTLRVLVACIAAPFLANTFGWLFTEMGRQPWMVYGLLKTARGSSPIVSVADVALSLGGFTLLYTVLGVTDVVLMARTARAGLEAGEAGGQGVPGDGQPTTEELIY